MALSKEWRNEKAIPSEKSGTQHLKDRFPGESTTTKGTLEVEKPRQQWPCQNTELGCTTASLFSPPTGGA